MTTADNKALLGGLNYGSWAPYMQADIQTIGGWGIIDGTETVWTPPNPEAVTLEDKKEIRRFNELKQKTAGLITQKLERSQLVHVNGIKDDPKAMWEKLFTVHRQQKPGTRYHAYNQLFGLRKEDDEPLDSLVRRADEMIEVIKALRPKVADPTLKPEDPKYVKPYDLDDLDQELACMSLIRSLPEEFSPFVSSYTMKAGDKFKLTDLQASFLAEQAQRYARGLDIMPTELAKLAGQTLCFLCDSPEHLQNNCPHFKKVKASIEAEKRSTGAKKSDSEPRWKKLKDKKKEGRAAAANGEQSAQSAATEFAGHVPLHT